jgi:hypothetical protein
MSSSETHSKDTEKITKDDDDDEVLSQIGEDPGLSADTIEQDSKARDDEQNKQGKDANRTKAKV